MCEFTASQDDAGVGLRVHRQHSVLPGGRPLGDAAGWGGGQKQRQIQPNSPPFSSIPLTCVQSLLDKISGE